MRMVPMVRHKTGSAVRCSDRLVRLLTIPLLSAVAVAPAAHAATMDSTAAALDACLAASRNASTAGQTECEGNALRAYDRRMNQAYGRLIGELSPAAAKQLRNAQRSWLLFRDSESAARRGIYETRQGTMFVPMAADDAVRIVRDRALQLEAYVRIMKIN